MKKDKKNKTNEEISFYSKEIKREKVISDDLKVARSFLIVLIVVVLVLCLLFFLNSKYISKDNFQDKTTTITTTASYNHYKITMSYVFDIKEDEYYVLFYDSDDEFDNGVYQALIGSYNSEEHKNINLYSVDLANPSNKSHFDKEGDQNINELKFNTETLIIIKNGKITSYETDINRISETLK